MHHKRRSITQHGHVGRPRSPLAVAFSSLVSLETVLDALLTPASIATIQVDPQLIVADLCSTSPGCLSASE